MRGVCEEGYRRKPVAYQFNSELEALGQKYLGHLPSMLTMLSAYPRQRQSRRLKRSVGPTKRPTRRNVTDMVHSSSAI